MLFVLIYQILHGHSYVSEREGGHVSWKNLVMEK